MMIMALRAGRLVVLDELDAKLHPKLLKYLIKMFKNSTRIFHSILLILLTTIKVISA